MRISTGHWSLIIIFRYPVIPSFLIVLIIIDLRRVLDSSCGAKYSLSIGLPKRGRQNNNTISGLLQSRMIYSTFDRVGRVTGHGEVWIKPLNIVLNGTASKYLVVDGIVFALSERVTSGGTLFSGYCRGLDRSVLILFRHNRAFRSPGPQVRP